MKTIRHSLTIISLHDAHITCACGWRLVRTGEITKDEALYEYRKHINPPRHDGTFIQDDRTPDQLKTHGYRLYSERGLWIVSTPAGPIPFVDNMIIDLKTHESDVPSMDDFKKEFVAEQKRLTTYINDYIAAILNGTIEQPGAGDCLYCQMAIQNPDTPPADHLNNHLDEHYLVPSLIFGAAVKCGESIAFKSDTHTRIFKTNKTLFFGDNAYSKIARRLLRKYFKTIGRN